MAQRPRSTAELNRKHNDYWHRIWTHRLLHDANRARRCNQAMDAIEREMERRLPPLEAL